jgi:hypothetical protein
MNALQLSLVLVASIWAAMNTLIAGYNAVNGTRDRIITGFTDEGIPLTLAHRQLIYQNDWRPLKVGLTTVSLAFGVFLLFLPQLGDEPGALRALCYVGSTLPFGSFLSFFVLGLRDRRHMLDVLEAEKQRIDDSRDNA